jgi:hypothetical protein
MSGIWRMVGSNSGESCRLAPAATGERGIPEPSGATDRFVPLLAVVDWRAARKFRSAGGCGDRPVHRDVIEAEAGHAVVGGEGSLEHLRTDTTLRPRWNITGTQGGRTTTPDHRITAQTENDHHGHSSSVDRGQADASLGGMATAFDVAFPLHGPPRAASTLDEPRLRRNLSAAVNL